MKREVPFRRVRLKSRGRGLRLKMPQTRVLKDLKFKNQKRLQLKRLNPRRLQLNQKSKNQPRPSSADTAPRSLTSRVFSPTLRRSTGKGARVGSLLLLPAMSPHKIGDQQPLCRAQRLPHLRIRNPKRRRDSPWQITRSCEKPRHLHLHCRQRQPLHQQRGLLPLKSNPKRRSKSHRA